MWRRIKRVLDANLGRFGTDPLAEPTRDLKEVLEHLSTLKEQVRLLEQDQVRLQGEAGRLEQEIRQLLDAGDRDEGRCRPGAMRVEHGWGLPGGPQLARTGGACARPAS